MKEPCCFTMKHYVYVVIVIILFISIKGNCQKIDTSFFDKGQANYIIDKEYDGNKGVINIPDNSTIIFQGKGRLSNFTIVGNGIKVVASADSFIFDNVTLDGHWIADFAYSNWFGFKSDCKMDSKGRYVTGSDNSDKLRNLLLFSNISIANGCYYFGKPEFMVRSKTHIEGNGAILKWVNSNAKTAFLVFGYANRTRLSGLSADSIVLNNFTIIGGKLDTYYKTESCHGLAIRNGKNIIINNVVSNLNRGDGLCIGNSHNNYNDDHIPSVITINNCTFDGNYRQGSSITRGFDIEYNNCTFRNTSGTPLMYGVDIEPSNATRLSQISDIRFNRCSFCGNKKGGLMIRSTPSDTTVINVRNVLVENCIFTNNWIFIKRISDLRIFNCKISTNNIGIYFDDNYTQNVSIVGCAITGANKGIGIFVQPFTKGSRDGLDISDCTIKGFNIGVSILKATNNDSIPVTQLIIRRNILIGNGKEIEIVK